MVVVVVVVEMDVDDEWIRLRVRCVEMKDEVRRSRDIKYGALYL